MRHASTFGENSSGVGEEKETGKIWVTVMIEGFGDHDTPLRIMRLHLRYPGGLRTFDSSSEHNLQVMLITRAT